MIRHELMSHQIEGVEFLTKQGSGLLAFEQGLGKTLVAIEAFRRLYAAGEAERMLVICPNSLKRNWAAEVSKFAPGLEWVIVEGPPPKRRRLFAEVASPVVITSYETARAETTAILDLLSRARTTLVLDESHAAKNPRSLTSTAARHFAPRSAHRWLLSGTPVTNSPVDLHAQVGIVSPERHPLGSAAAFLSDAENPTPATRDHILERLRPYVLRRTKQECMDLPEKIFVDQLIELPCWQRKLYNDMRDQMVCEIAAMDGKEYRAFASTALVRLTRLCQLASNPSLLIPQADEERVPGKWAELDSVVREVIDESREKVIIWSNYVASIERLQQRYADLGAVVLYGGVDPSERQTIAKTFQQNNEIRVLIANPAAAGTGFTLTAASFTVYESLSWRYDFYAQSQDRNHRIGQTVPVTYLRLIAADTIEEAIVQALERKGEMAKTLLGDPLAEQRIQGLTQEQMCELLLKNRLPNG